MRIEALLALTLLLSATGSLRAEPPAIAALREQAEQGDLAAALSLGMRYRDGAGVERDHVEALRWYRRCADGGDAAGMDNVGFMHLRGWGVPEDFDIAAGYFRAGAGRGDPQALYNLGNCYFSGQGVEQEYARAIESWEKAAARGSRNAIWRLAVLHAAGEGMPPNRKKARELCETVADQEVNAMLLLGELHVREGEEESARRWWAKASGKGNKQASALLQLAEWRHKEAVKGERAYVEVDHLYQGWNNCGSTSIAMFARQAGCATDPYEVKRLCPQSPIGTGTDWAHLVEAGEQLGQAWELVTFPHDEEGFDEGVDRIRRHLDAGESVVIDFTVTFKRNGETRRSGHTLLVVGYNSELDQFVIKNPNQPSPGIELLSAEELEANWYSRGYSRSARGQVARPLIVRSPSRP